MNLCHLISSLYLNSNEKRSTCVARFDSTCARRISFNFISLLELQVSLDTNSMNDFQNYVRGFDFRRIRVGYLYGVFKEDGVRADFIYEPPQECTDTHFQLHDDPLQVRRPLPRLNQ